MHLIRDAAPAHHDPSADPAHAAHAGLTIADLIAGR
jgi:hypothetical protein